MKQLLCVFVLVLLVSVDTLYLRSVNAIRQVDGAVIDTGKIVSLVTTDRHLINRSTLKGLVNRVATTTLNFRPGRVNEHVETKEIRDFFVDQDLYDAFSKSFIRWGLAQYDNGDIVFKESVVLEQRSTRTVNAGNGKLLWFVNVRMSMRDRAFGDETTSIVVLKLTLMHKSAAEGVGIYDYEIQSI